jgi:PAS domain-containing protein
MPGWGTHVAMVLGGFYPALAQLVAFGAETNYLALVVVAVAAIFLLWRLWSRHIEHERLKEQHRLTREAMEEQIRQRTAALEKEVADRTRAEADLRQVLASARCLLWTADVVMREGKLKFDFRIDNEAICQEFLPLKPKPGQPWWRAWIESRFPQDQKRANETSHNAAVTGQRGYEQEFRCIRADGAVQWIHEAVRIEPRGENQWRFYGTCTDITGRKQREEELQRIISGAHCLLFHATVEYVDNEWFRWNVTLMNSEQVQSFMPLKVDDGESWSDAWFKSWVPEDKTRMDLVSRDALLSGKTGYTNEFRCRRMDGTTHWWVEDVQAEKIGENRWYCVGVCMDINDQKKTEEALQRLVETAPCLLWQSHVERVNGHMSWNIQISNSNSLKEFLPLDLAPGQSWTDAWDKSKFQEDMARMDDTSREAMLAGKPGYTQEFRCRRKDGRTVWLYEDVKIQKVAENHWYCVGVCTDITAKKEAEEELQRVMQSARCLLWYSVVEKRGGTMNWSLRISNSSSAQDFLPLQLRPGQSWVQAWDESKFQVDVERTERTSREAIEAGRPGYSHEFRCRRADGEVRWLYEDAHILSLGPNLWHVVGVVTDITDRKRSEEEMHYLLGGAKCLLWHSITYEYEGSYTWDVKMPSEVSLQEFLKLDVKPGQTWSMAWYECKFKEDLARMDQVCLDALRGNKRGYANEFRCRLGNGEVRWLYEEVKIEQIKHNVWHLVGICTDITDRKNAEAEREKLIEELKRALAEVKTLSGLLPICASCKRIRDDGGYWNQIESYIKTHSEVQFSHGLCPECITKLYPDLEDLNAEETS